MTCHRQLSDPLLSILNVLCICRMAVLKGICLVGTQNQLAPGVMWLPCHPGCWGGSVCRSGDALICGGRTFSLSFFSSETNYECSGLCHCTNGDSCPALARDPSLPHSPTSPSALLHSAFCCGLKVPRVCCKLLGCKGFSGASAAFVFFFFDHP